MNDGTLQRVLVLFMPEAAAGRSAVHKYRKSAFTLIELLAVMTIILILAAMVLFMAKFVTEKAKRAKAEAYVKAKCAEVTGVSVR